MPNQYVATDTSTGLEVTVTGEFPEDPEDRVRIARTSTLFTRLMATILAMEDATPRREGFRAVETQLELDKFQDEVENVPADRLKRIAPEQAFSVSMVKKRVDDFEKEVAERTKTLDLKNKRDILVRIIEMARERAKRAIADEIRDKTNERIAELMPNNSVQVDRVEDALLLRGQSGGSAGENLSVGYAFLATLFNRAHHHQLPFVVDSPVVPIDGHIRPTIGNLLPRLTGQVVAFVISTEREGFLPSLERANNGETQIGRASCRERV